ncbi:MAG: TRAP transporter small permease [[Pasteurella] mairii]|uniref:TRAP transporter small permease protein n=2 Tax=[Pasteurella] aerogenes-[Pasteurella] mairii-[Actinobacillus] rossii complex TaxID=310966 RepID=A0A380TUU0_9PAST|nr:TRAP transporter small permease [[Actinobacillus] rossii]MDY4280975.1 TRAP transporter small permease [[Pasteurella] mairii]MDY4505252.1 TRAP transporter small permease [[Actinobacillus] rossii]SUB32852.1 Trap-type c4-dicarboxylate transport system, small permease component [[Pasteurella] mairii]SUT92443.1 tripartite ATP-independent periplasmic transporter DctQ [[Actinobacillus] rossii]
MSKIVRLVNQAMAIFSVLLSAVLVVCVVWQVISRYVLGAPSIVTDELARFLFMWVGLIGAAYATGLKRHLAIDLLLLKMQGKNKTSLEVVILLVMIFFAGYILLYGGGNLAWDTHLTGQVSPSLGIDMGLVYLCLPVSGAIMLFYLLIDLIGKFSSERKGI